MSIITSSSECGSSNTTAARQPSLPSASSTSPDSTAQTRQVLGQDQVGLEASPVHRIGRRFARQRGATMTPRTQPRHKPQGWKPLIEPPINGGPSVRPFGVDGHADDAPPRGAKPQAVLDEDLFAYLPRRLAYQVFLQRSFEPLTKRVRPAGRRLALFRCSSKKDCATLGRLTQSFCKRVCPNVLELLVCVVLLDLSAPTRRATIECASSWASSETPTSKTSRACGGTAAGSANTTRLVSYIRTQRPWHVPLLTEVAGFTACRSSAAGAGAAEPSDA